MIHSIPTGGRAVTVARGAEMSLIVMVVVVIVMNVVMLVETSELDAIYIGNTGNTTQHSQDKWGTVTDLQGKKNLIFTEV